MAFDPTTAVEFDESTAVPFEPVSFDPDSAVAIDTETATPAPEEQPAPTGKPSFREEYVEPYKLDYPTAPDMTGFGKVAKETFTRAMGMPLGTGEVRVGPMGGVPVYVGKRAVPKTAGETIGQAVGEIGGTIPKVASMALVGPALLPKALVSAAPRFASILGNALAGAGYGATEALAEGKGTVETVKETGKEAVLWGAIDAVFKGGSAAVKAIVKRVKSTGKVSAADVKVLNDITDRVSRKAGIALETEEVAAQTAEELSGVRKSMAGAVRGIENVDRWLADQADAFIKGGMEAGEARKAAEDLLETFKSRLRPENQPIVLGAPKKGKKPVYTGMEEVPPTAPEPLPPPAKPAAPPAKIADEYPPRKPHVVPDEEILSDQIAKFVKRGKSEEEAKKLAQNWLSRLSEDEKANLSETIYEATTDPLTGLKNKGWLYREGYLARRKTDIAPKEKERLLILDIDHFKKVNDTYGHDVGDEVLADFGDFINAELVDAGLGKGSRYGGEEFAFIPHANITDEQILRRIHELREPFAKRTFADGKLSNVQFSVGLGSGLKGADEQLYLAKQAGRNRSFIGGKEYVPEIRRSATSKLGEGGGDSQAAEGTAPETGAGEGPTGKKPGILARIFGRQKTIKPTTAGSRKAENLAVAQERKVKDIYKQNTDSFIDRSLVGMVDTGSWWKRRLLKNEDAKQVVIYHDLARGSKGEAERQIRGAIDDIEKALPSLEDSDLLTRYIQAKRGIELEKLKGPKYKQSHGITAKDYQEQLDDIAKQYPKEFKAIEEAAQKYYNAISREPLDKLVAEGLMTRDAADKLLKEHAHYSPLYFVQHIDPEGVSIAGTGARVSVPDSGIKALAEGSEQELLNNWRLNLHNVISRTEARIGKNRANKALREYAVKNPGNDLGVEVEKPKSFTKEGKPVWGDLKPGQERVYTMIGGKQYAVTMPTRMAKSWQLTDPLIDQSLAKGIRALSGSSVVKVLATGANPEFALSNLPRDLMHIWLVTKEYSSALPMAVAQMAKDMKEVLRDAVGRKGLYHEYVRRGGSMDFLTTQGALRGKKPWESVSGADKALQQLIELGKWTGETSEILTRLALMKRAIKNGKSMDEATWIARSYMDFSLGGSWAKSIDNAVPYFNAAIQGTRGVFRAFKTDPKVATFKVAQVVTAGSLLAYWNRKTNQECWDSISDAQKVRNWIFTTPFTYLDKEGNKRHFYVSIPKEQSQRMLAAVGEELMEKSTTGKSNFEKIVQGANDFLPVSPADVGTRLPPTMSAFLGYVTNKDFWLNEDMWKGRKGISPEQEIYPSTPMPYVKLGELLGMSPVRMEKGASKVFPTNMFTGILGMPFNEKFEDLSDPEKAELSKPFIDRFSQVPALRRYLKMTYPTKDAATILERANKLMISDVDESGNLIPIGKLKKQVEESERNIADIRAVNDRKFKQIMHRFGVLTPEGQKKLALALKDVEDEGEAKRLEQLISREERRGEKQEIYKKEIKERETKMNQ